MVGLNIRCLAFIKIISINFDDKENGWRWEVKSEDGGEEEGEREEEKKEEGRKNN